MTDLATLQGLMEFDTALLSNTRGYIDTTPEHTWYMGGYIQSQTPSIGPIAGIAATCKIDTSTPGRDPDFDLYYEHLDTIAAIDLPVIWVVETVGSRPDFECVTGDGMAKALHAAGCLGVVTDGHCRDIAGCETVPFAVHCRGTIGHHAALRAKEIDTPVEVGGITVSPGDIIHADREGVIKISDEIAPLLVEKAPLMRAFEQEGHALIRRTDISGAEKKQIASKLLKKWGFK